MNLLNLFKKKSKVSNKDIILFDTSNIDMPEYENLNSEDKFIVERLKKEIRLEDYNTINNYIDFKRDTGNKITNLLIGMLIELKEELESLSIKINLRNNFTINSESLVNYQIKCKKIELLNQELENLKKEIILKTIAVRELIKKNKLGLFFKVFKNNDYHNLKNLEGSLKVLISVLDSQTKVTNKATIEANALIKELENLNEKETVVLVYVDNIWKLEYIYNKKLKEYTKVFKLVDEFKFSNKEYLESLIKDYFDNKEEIILELAKDELLIDKVKDSLKDKVNDIFKRRVRINTNLTSDDIEYLDLLIDWFKDRIDIDKREIYYKKKFWVNINNILDWDNNRLTNVLEPLEKDIYDNIINQELEEFFRIKLNKNNYKKYLKEIRDYHLNYRKKYKKVSIGVILIAIITNHPRYFQKYINESVILLSRYKRAYPFIINYNSDVFTDEESRNGNCFIDKDVDFEKLLRLPFVGFDNFSYSISRRLEEFDVHMNKYNHFDSRSFIRIKDIATGIVVASGRYNESDSLFQIDNNSLTIGKGVTKIEISSNSVAYYKLKNIKTITYSSDAPLEVLDFVDWVLSFNEDKDNVKVYKNHE